MTATQKIRTFLWFDDNAEEAMNFYVSVFKNSCITGVQRAGPDGPVFSGSFELDGQQFMALNGGPEFHFSEAISLFVDCKDQAEVDELWERLLAGGGEPSRCGWLKDRFGLSWQIIPARLGELLGSPEREKADRALQAMLRMQKIDVAELERAYEGGQ